MQQASSKCYLAYLDASGLAPTSSTQWSNIVDSFGKAKRADFRYEIVPDADVTTSGKLQYCPGTTRDAATRTSWVLQLQEGNPVYCWYERGQLIPKSPCQAQQPDWGPKPTEQGKPAPRLLEAGAGTKSQGGIGMGIGAWLVIIVLVIAFLATLVAVINLSRGKQ